MRSALALFVLLPGLAFAGPSTFATYDAMNSGPGWVATFTGTSGLVQEVEYPWDRHMIVGQFRIDFSGFTEAAPLRLGVPGSFMVDGQDFRYQIDFYADPSLVMISGNCMPLGYFGGGAYPVLKDGVYSATMNVLLNGAPEPASISAVTLGLIGLGITAAARRRGTSRRAGLRSTTA